MNIVFPLLFVNKIFLMHHLFIFVVIKYSWSKNIAHINVSWRQQSVLFQVLHLIDFFFLQEDVISNLNTMDERIIEELQLP